MSEAHERALDALRRRGRLRRLDARHGIDFSSNDYLGLASSAAFQTAIREALDRGVPVGSGGSRLLRGNHPEHEALEAEAAVYFGGQSALYFSTGFGANAAILATLPAHGDLIAYDALIHASAHDGMRLSKADAIAFRHNDLDHLTDAIKAWRDAGGTGRIWIAVESLYSMDGDVAPLDDLHALTERHDAFLLIDEAHATGVFGHQGRGLAERFEGHERVITLHTCGKALGASGALVISTTTIRDYLINRARGFIYATAPSPLMAAAVRAALTIVAAADEERKQLHALVAHTGDALRAQTPFSPSHTQIIPLIVGDDRSAVALAEALRAGGFDIRAIRPPTVPEGTARLRLSLTLNATADDVNALAAALAEALAAGNGAATATHAIDGAKR